MGGLRGDRVEFSSEFLGKEFERASDGAVGGEFFTKLGDVAGRAVQFLSDIAALGEEDDLGEEAWIIVCDANSRAGDTPQECLALMQCRSPGEWGDFFCNRAELTDRLLQHKTQGLALASPCRHKTIERVVKCRHNSFLHALPRWLDRTDDARSLEDIGNRDLTGETEFFLECLGLGEKDRSPGTVENPPRDTPCMGKCEVDLHTSPRDTGQRPFAHDGLQPGSRALGVKHDLRCFAIHGKAFHDGGPRFRAGFASSVSCHAGHLKKTIRFTPLVSMEKPEGDAVQIFARLALGQVLRDFFLMSHSASSSRYEHMEYRRCGNSGLHLPAISLGLWHNFGGVDDLTASRAMLLRAFDLGMTHFDLANNYGPPPGSAEETFGRILESDLSAYRDELIVSTKAGYRMWEGPYGDGGSRKYLLSSLDQSLRRMRLDYVDIFYSHRQDDETPLEETVGALVQAVRSGKALYAGVSNYSPEWTRRAAELLSAAGVPLLIHQPLHHLLNRRLEKSGLAEVLLELGIGCIAFCPLAQGVLTNRYLHGIEKDSRAGKPHGFLKADQITEDKLRKVRALAVLAEARGQSLAQFSLAWVLSRPAVTTVLIGASKPTQIEENAAALKNYSFSPEELAAIDAACLL